MTRLLLAPLLLSGMTACSEPSAGPALDLTDPAPLSVDAWVEDKAGGTDLVVRTQREADVDASLTARIPDALELGEPRVEEETVGGRVVRTQRHRVGGAAGHYVLDQLCATIPGQQPVCASPVYLDLSVPGGAPDMADIVEPDAVSAALPWLLVGLVGLGAGVATLLLLWALARRRPAAARAAPVPEEAPHEAALRRWELVRADPGLSDMDKAHALSEITRTYLDAALRFPAAKWSTTEILEHLTRLTALPEGNVPRVRRLLRATDRVKYAGDQPGSLFFEELDSDLRALIDATRPRSWTPDGPAPTGPAEASP